MYNYAWSKKKEWATAYIEDLSTCGAMRHAVLKQHANIKSLIGLFDSIHKLVTRQHVFEIRKGRDESRPVELST